MTHCMYITVKSTKMPWPLKYCRSHHIIFYPTFCLHTVQSFLTLILSRVNEVVRTQFGGTPMGESAMVNTSDVGSLVEFTFNVSHLHHLDYIRPPGLYIAFTLCVLLTHISFIPTLSLKDFFLSFRNVILRGEGIVM